MLGKSDPARSHSMAAVMSIVDYETVQCLQDAVLDASELTVMYHIACQHLQQQGMLCYFQLIYFIVYIQFFKVQ